METFKRLPPGGLLLTLLNIALCLVLILNGAPQAGGQEKTSQTVEKPMSSTILKDVLRQHTPELMSLPGVVGTAQGLCDGSVCIKVLVTDKSPELEQKIDGILKGYPYEIQKTGKIKARPHD